MTIDEILEQMDDILDKAVTVPFSAKKSLIDTSLMREYIDQIRYNLPTEIKQAKEMVYDRTQIINDGKKESEAIIKRAEEKVKILVSQQEVVKRANEQAKEIISHAQRMEIEIRKALGERMDEIMDETEVMLNKNLSDIKQTRAAIKTATRKK